jgi:ribonucleoside-diphosphate reductase alpha chain
LQHGVPLDSFVDALTHLRFAPAGIVESDPAVERAASIPDYVFRSLAASYLGRSVAPDDFQEDPMPAEPAPLLPLDLPRGARRRPALRLVAS